MPVDASELIIEPAGEADIDLLAEMNAGLSRDEGASIANQPHAFFVERMTGFLAGEYAAMVLRDGDVPVGYVLYRRHEGYLHVRQYYIVEDYRRQGLGRACFERLRREVFPPDMPIGLEVLTTNPRGNAFWRAVGFAPLYTAMRMPPLNDS